MMKPEAVALVMKWTRFGQAVRKHRIDRGMRLKEMADKLGLQMSTVSATETGRRNPSPRYVEQVIECLGLTDQDAVDLKQAAAESQRQQKLVLPRVHDQAKAALAASLARRFQTLTPEQVFQILKVLKDEEDE